MKYYYIAQAYGSDNYGECTYNDAASTCTTTGSGSSSSSSAGAATSGLANTGIYVLLIVSLACLLIFLALAVRLIRRKRKTSRTDLPATIPGERPVDTPQSIVGDIDTPEAEKPQPPKRIDF